MSVDSPAADDGPRSHGGSEFADRAARVRNATASELRQVLRDPLLLALVVALPGYFVGAWGAIVPDATLTVPIATSSGMTEQTMGMSPLIAAVIAPMASALVVGITALFAVQRAREADRRLRVAGYRPAEILAGRLAVLGLVALVATGIAVGVAYVHVEPAHPLWFLFAVALAGGVYGAVGAVLGQVFDRLPGVYVLLFLPMIDMMILQNPLADPPWWATYLPGHHPIRLAGNAAFADAVAVGHAFWGVVALVLAIGAAGAATTVGIR